MLTEIDFDFLYCNEVKYYPAILQNLLQAESNCIMTLENVLPKFCKPLYFAQNFPCFHTFHTP